MSYSRISMNLTFNILNFCSLFSFPSRKSTPRVNIYDYSKFISGIDYIFETLPEPLKACMTGFGKGIKPGNLVILPADNQLNYYQVEQIDYYSNPSDMWIALLQKLPNQNSKLKIKN